MNAARETINNERDSIVKQLEAAGLLIEDWGDLDEQIAKLEAQGIAPLCEPIKLPNSAHLSETLVDEDRGDY